MFNKAIKNRWRECKLINNANNHEGIISREQFQAVQEEKARRSNVVQQGNEVKRAAKKYSTKPDSN
ncbi:recombinase [Aerococcaceae bacterium DSM 111176]|nr:recombinase [Aerococcaceae bacterium DSM 111176]